MPFPLAVLMNAWARSRGISLTRREVREKKSKSSWTVCRFLRAAARIVTVLPTAHDQGLGALSIRRSYAEGGKLGHQLDPQALDCGTGRAAVFVVFKEKGGHNIRSLPQRVIQT